MVYKHEAFNVNLIYGVLPLENMHFVEQTKWLTDIFGPEIDFLLLVISFGQIIDYAAFYNFSLPQDNPSLQL